MSRLIVPAFAVGLAFALGGCATIVNGTKQKYPIASDPAGAVATTSEGHSCVTPCEIKTKRAHDMRVDFKKDGYEQVYLLVQSREGGAIAGNVALTSPLGLGIDALSGASRILYPRPASVQLVLQGSGKAALLLDKNGNVISSVNEQNDKVRMDVAKTIGVERAGLSPEQVAAYKENHKDTEGTAARRQKKKQKS